MHFPRPPAEGPAAGWAARIIAALMPAAGHRGGEGRGGGPEGREGCVRLPAPFLRPSVPPPHAAGARTGAGPSSTFLAAAAKPRDGGSRVLTMSVALSNRFQGRRHCPPSAPPPARSPAPPSLRVVSPAGHLCAPGGPRGLPRAGSRRGRGSARPGETPASRAVSLSVPGGKAFGLLKARQERRLAEINRVSARRLGQVARRRSCATLAPKTPNVRWVPPPSARLCLPQNQPPFFPRASPNVLPPPLPLCLRLQVGPPPPPPPRSGPSVSGCKLLLLDWGGRAGRGALMPATRGLPGSPPGTKHRDLVLEGTPMSRSSPGFTAWGGKGGSERRAGCPEMAQQVRTGLLLAPRAPDSQPSTPSIRESIGRLPVPTPTLTTLRSSF